MFFVIFWTVCQAKNKNSCLYEKLAGCWPGPLRYFWLAFGLIYPLGVSALDLFLNYSLLMLFLSSLRYARCTHPSVVLTFFITITNSTIHCILHTSLLELESQGSEGLCLAIPPKWETRMERHNDTHPKADIMEILAFQEVHYATSWPYSTWPNWFLVYLVYAFWFITSSHQLRQKFSIPSSNNQNRNTFAIEFFILRG